MGIVVNYSEDVKGAEDTLPTGVPLRAKVVSVEEKTINYTDKSTGEPKSFKKLNWKFALTDHDDKWVWGDTDNFISGHQRNVLKKWIEAIRRSPLKPGDTLDITDLIGLPVSVELATREYNGKTYYNVTNLVEQTPSPEEPPF
jgi:hypothetical protein